MSELPGRGGWINTFTGKQFFPLADDPGEIDPRDVAHALSNLCRYNGHVRRHYSVAEHCVRLARFVWRETLAGGGDVVLRLSEATRLARYALLHDASEAYLGDLVLPLKQLPEFRFYLEAERRLQSRIYRRFGLSLEAEPQRVRELDKQIIGSEARALFDVRHPEWDPFMPPALDYASLVGADNVGWWDDWGWTPTRAEAYFLRALEWLALA